LVVPLPSKTVKFNWFHLAAKTDTVIKNKMGRSAFKIAYDTGRKMTLDEAVASVLNTKL
jgi:hypothetical protein